MCHPSTGKMVRNIWESLIKTAACCTLNLRKMGLVDFWKLELCFLSWNSNKNDKNDIRLEYVYLREAQKKHGKKWNVYMLSDVRWIWDMWPFDMCCFVLKDSFQFTAYHDIFASGAASFRHVLPESTVAVNGRCKIHTKYSGIFRV